MRLIPSGGKFIAEAERQRELRIQANDVFGVQRSEPRTPAERRRRGIVQKTSLAVPCRKVCKLVNVAWPYWLSARFSFDRSRWNQAPTLN